MSQKKTFAQKMLSSTHKIVCPVCNSEMDIIRAVGTVKSEKKGAFKYSDNITKVCKCNEKEVYA